MDKKNVYLKCMEFLEHRKGDRKRNQFLLRGHMAQEKQH